MEEDFLLVLKALADQTRLEIVRLLLINSFCVKALAARLAISESAISQHLKILRKAGLVMGEKKGYYVHYKIKKENILLAAESLKGFVSNIDQDG